MTTSSSLDSRFTFRSRGRFIRRGNEATATSLTRDLKNSKVGDLSNLVKNLNSVSIGVGYSSTGVHSSSGLTYAFLASILEFGTRDGRIPARPYLRLSGEIVSQQINTDTASTLRALALSNQPMTKASIGRAFLPLAKSVELKTQRIMYSRSAAVASNAPSTIRSKGFDSPWIKTGELVARLQGIVRIN